MLEQIHPSQVLSLRPLAYSQVWMNEAPWLQMGNCSTGSLIGASQSCPAARNIPASFSPYWSREFTEAEEDQGAAGVEELLPSLMWIPKRRTLEGCNTPIHSWKCQDSVTSDVALSQQSLHGASQHPLYFLVHPHSFVPFCARLSSIAW